ncbi:MAG: DUF1028 domain-containing protein, partial [Actinobacteria bacterium]|nr:DUF1028 domain-containing protein [Actinomycetota bacterium]
MRSRLLALLAAGLTIVAPASATWSIVVVNKRTGEVAVAGATCIVGANLLEIIPVALVGKGAGVIQARGSPAGLVVLHEGLLAGEDPQTILSQIFGAVGRRSSLQIGIVDFTGSPVTFTGGSTTEASGGVKGELGDLAYAIQGNILTGAAVWLEAEKALLATSGDLSQKMMAAMEAARAFGGDGRCSCPLGGFTGCGAPPPTFKKSAHCGFVLLARIGDADPGCVPAPSCASGSYYLLLNVEGGRAQIKDPDPVLQLQDLYADWRANLVGHPDGILSTVDAVQSMPADGVTRRTVTVKLVDLDGVALTSGGASVEVATVDGGPSLSSAGAVSDHGDGSYSFELAAGTQVGLDRFVISADDGVIRSTLYPYLEVRLDPVAPLHVGYDEISESKGANVPFVVNEPSKPKGRYWILGSLSGTVPGVKWGTV